MNKIELMNIQRQHEEHADEYEAAALRVLRSGTYIGGVEVTEFEKEFAAYQGAKFGISCGNGTDALILALRALGIGPEDEVITVAWTFFATAESIAAVGATPVFIDVDSNTYCMDASLIERKITNKTKAVLPVNFYGHSCDIDEIKRICDKYHLYLILDCAQSTGTLYKGKRSNTLGLVSCFSFFPTKNLGCDGDGGMVLTDDENIARACRSLKVHGSGKDGLFTLKREFERKKLKLPENLPNGETKYFNYLIGVNSRLDAIQAAILREKLKHIDDFIKRRRHNAEIYNKSLQHSSYMTPFEASYCNHSYYIYALRHKNAGRIMEILKLKGVPCGVYYPVPLHLQGAFSNLSYKEGDLPVTENLAKTTFAIPVYPELHDDEREFIIKMLLAAEKEAL